MENSYAKIYFINFSDFSIEYISKKIMIFSEKKKKKETILSARNMWNNTKLYIIITWLNLIFDL